MITSYFYNTYFAWPQFFLLLLIIPALIYWYIRKEGTLEAAIKVSTTQSFKDATSWRTTLRHLPFILRLLAIACIILALARPQVKNDEQQADGEGVDIVLSIDVSGSMMAQDFKPNRMEAAKKVAQDFIDKRLTDRIGIVIFSGESFTLCPVTTDHSILKSAIESINNGLLKDGTSIGDGLATAVDRLRSSTSKSKVVVLLTDGENNDGLIGPDNAKEIAKTFGVKVYTIGVGSDGYAPFPIKTELGIVMQQQKVNIDEKLLKEIAAETGGKYFRARDNASLESIYTEIDRLEKSKVQITTFTHYTEKFFPLAMLALFFLFIEVLLRFTILKKFP